jgi:hypothetical protein
MSDAEAVIAHNHNHWLIFEIGHSQEDCRTGTNLSAYVPASIDDAYREMESRMDLVVWSPMRSHSYHETA